MNGMELSCTYSALKITLKGLKLLTKSVWWRYLGIVSGLRFNTKDITVIFLNILSLSISHHAEGGFFNHIIAEERGILEHYLGTSTIIRVRNNGEKSL